MPELPEVQTVVDTVRPRIVGRRIERLTLHRDDFATPRGFDWSCLTGRSIADVRRRAKRIVFHLDDGRRFFAHLGMSGRMTFCDAATPLAKHTHVVLRFDHGELRQVDPRRFGGLHWLGDDPGDANLGPEPFDLTPAMLGQRLAKTARPIKSALLDQALVAGLGNIYVDEALHAAGVHPLALCRDVPADAVRRLNRSIKTILRRAIRFKGSTLRDYVDADGNPGGFRLQHRVYDRAGTPCRACGTPIERIVLGNRSTHFCPTCQPTPPIAPPPPPQVI